MPKPRQANLKPAPLALTPALVAKLVGDRPAYGKGIAHIPIEGVLVDRPGCAAEEVELEAICAALRASGGAAWPELRARALALAAALSERG